jgi:hypothetical protein
MNRTRAADHSLAPRRHWVGATSPISDKYVDRNSSFRCVDRWAGSGGLVLRAGLAGSRVADAQSDADSWWLVLADSELGAEIGRVLGDDSG